MSGEVNTDLAYTSWAGPYGNGLMDLILYCSWGATVQYVTMGYLWLSCPIRG